MACKKFSQAVHGHGEIIIQDNVYPGNISRMNHQIGVSGKFAVFPDYETGHLALLDCLNPNYGLTGRRGLN